MKGPLPRAPNHFVRSATVAGQRSREGARFTLRRVIASAAAVLVALGGGACAAGNENERRPKGPQKARAQLTPAAAGVQIRPILSTGEMVGTYQMSGVPDGLGAYAASGPRAQGGGGEGLQVMMNHELDGEKPSGVGARISQLDLDRTARRVRAARYPLDGSEGFLRFCSATLATMDGRRLFLTGEESTDDGDLTSARDDGLGRGGSSIALDPETGRYRETRHFGLLPHENLVPVDGLDEAVVLTTEDGEPGENESQLYAYIAPSFRHAIAGRRGSLHVWKADRRRESDADPSTDDIAEGERVRGRFVPLSEEDNADADALEDAAQAKDAFDFERLEDAALSRTGNGSLHIADTGAAGSQSVRGRLYRFDFERSDPRRATLTLELDADAQALRPDPVKLVNPDNLDTSARDPRGPQRRASRPRDRRRVRTGAGLRPRHPAPARGGAREYPLSAQAGRVGVIRGDQRKRPARARPLAARRAGSRAERSTAGIRSQALLRERRGRPADRDHDPRQLRTLRSVSQPFHRRATKCSRLADG